MLTLCGALAQKSNAQVFNIALSTSSTSSTVEVYEFEAVEERPEFPGGERGLLNYINSERQYPHEAYSKGIQGRVLVSFIICTDGSVSNIAVIKGVEDSLNDEAVRIVSRMPRWTPGKVENERVYVRLVLPIVFRL